jgi:nucleotide-binding universal stress UspA family protein
MHEIKRILVPIDFTEPSKKALGYGLSLAIELNATLTLVHVAGYSIPLAYAYPDETHEMTKMEMDEVKQRLRELIHSDFRESVNTRFVLKAGNVEDEVLGATAEEKADLVVMGTHGRRRFERWLLGSVTEHLLRKSKVPILTVSHLDSDHEIDEPRPIPLKRLLFATDLSDSPGRAMEMALNLTREFSAELTVLHVLPKIEWAYGAEFVPLDIEASTAKIRSGAVERLEASLPESAREDPRVRTELVEGVPYERILAAADEGGIDVIILNTHGKSGVERALLGSTAERVVRGAHVPVLSVPPGG